MNNVRPPDVDLSALQRSAAACLASILELDIADVPLPGAGHPEPWTVWRNWLGQRGLGLVPVVDPVGFSWPGPWLAVIRSDEHGGDIVAVAFGSPPGLAWNPLGGAETFDAVHTGFVIAPADVALWQQLPQPTERDHGRVEAIAIAAAAEAPVRAVEEATAHAGRGLEGDRYFMGDGTFSNPHARGHDLTLVEAEVLEELGLRAEPAPTQVVARDRHAELLAAMALAGADLERLAVEVRHLQRTEVREAEEPFAEGQKGSSAMPHKRNPIVAERITGLARLLRGYAVAGLEDVALWHERDISHSSVERVVLPDACTVLDYALDRAAWLVGGLRVFPQRMRANLDAAGGLAGSSAALLALVDAGWARERAYATVQRAAMAAWEGAGGFRDLLLASPGVAEALAGLPGGLDGVLEPARFVAGAGPVFERLEALGRPAAGPALAAAAPAGGSGADR
jgi:hypothetical protein